MSSNTDAALPLSLHSGMSSFSIGLSALDADPFRQGEARFRALAQATGQIYWIADAQGHLIDSASWCAFTGQTSEEAADDGWAAALHPDDYEPTLVDWKAAVAARRPYRHEHRARRADGQYRLMLVQAYPVLDADGAIQEWVGVNTDITLLQELRADVQTSQEDFQATFEQAAVGMAHVRLDNGRFLRANRKLCEILGYTHEELLCHTFQELTYSPDLDTNLVLLEQLVSGTIATYTLEKRYIRKDGSLVWANLTTSLKRDRTGTPEYGIAVVEDISARKAAEEALRQSEQQYHQLFETMAQGVIYSSASGEMLAANPAALRILGLTQEEIQGHTALDPRWHVIHEDGSALRGDDFPSPRALRTGQPVSDVVGVFNSKEQAYRWLKVAVVPEYRPGASAPFRVFATFEDITKRRRLEEELRARVQELETIFASMSDGLIVIGGDGEILRANPAYAALVGWPAGSAFYAMSAQERYRVLQIRDGQGQPIPPDQMPIAQAFQGERVEGEQSFRSRDGREVYASMRGAPLTDAAGRVIGAVLVFHDITERRRLEEELRAQAQELEKVFASINEGLIVLGADGQILRTNPAYATLAGWPGGSALYTMATEERLRTLYIRDEQGQFISSDQFSTSRLLRGESIAETQIFRRRDGRDVHVNLRGAPLTDAAGRVMGAVVVLHDDTERRLLEQQTREALKALLRMAELLVQQPPGSDELPSPLVGQHLAELACSLLGCPVAIILTLDPQTLGMRVMAAVGPTGTQREQLHAVIESWSHTAPDLAHLARLMDGETLVLDVTEPPYEGVAALFGIQQAVVAPMRLGGRLMGMVVFNPGKLAQDFTEEQIALAGATAQLVGLVVEREGLLHEREEARAHALALHESNQQMDTFLGLVSHELRTPLATMKLAIQLIHRRLEREFFEAPAAENSGLDLLTALQELFAPVERQTVRLERLVKDLLDASRSKEGKLEPVLARADLSAIVREVVAEQRELLPERVIELHTPAEAEGIAPSRLSAGAGSQAGGVAPTSPSAGAGSQALMALVDSDFIRQAVTNYLTNALKYSPGQAPVLVGVERQAEQVLVWVRDQGPGIALADQERIWDRFYRVPGIREQRESSGGLGLGLYVTRMLIERHQGQVGMTSTPGQGTTFWFTLPLAE